MNFSFVFFFASSFLSITNGKQCTVLLDSIFSNCTSRQGELEDFKNDDLNRVYSLNTTHVYGNGGNGNGGGKCTNEDICRKIFHVGRLRGQSFGAKTLVQLSYILARCCGECARYYRSDVNIDEFASNTSIAESYDLLYPVIGRLSVDNMYGYHFIPVFQVPGAFYLTLGKSKKELSEDMILACLNMWPLFVMCIILSFLSGFVAWIAECRANKQEFPTNFFLGMYEGFWWSFVSMTTVGYGDKVPKTVPGRIFSIIWILIGITITGIFTANLTSQIINSGAPVVSNQLNGKKVGILKHQLHDAIMVAQYGGIAHEIDYNVTIHGISDLLQKLNRKELDGMLMNRATYFFFYRSIAEEIKYENISKQVDSMNILRQEMSFKDKQIVIGMLVKEEKYFTYFKRYYESNWFQIQSCFEYSLNFKDKKYDVSQFPSLEGLFYPFLYWSIGILGVIVVCGTIYEIVKYFVKNSRNVRGQ